MHEQDGESEPAHHARRPMNAFLIFCKRHRSVVRDKYPNLENRSITKILGEWWANLEKEEKACYTGLAKQLSVADPALDFGEAHLGSVGTNLKNGDENSDNFKAYKDAFFSANPDFKWYKLPAPPLRTLSSRPRDAPDKPNEAPNAPERYLETEVEKTNNNSTKVDFNKKSTFRDDLYESKPLSMFTPGKLADEAQMGGLSRLLATKTENQTPNPYYSPTPFKFNAISTPHNRSHIKHNGPNREDSIRELQNALSETTKVFEEDFDENRARIYGYGAASDQYTNQDMIDQIVDKRYSKEDDYIYQRNYSDDERNVKSGRSCKGKRYQEFMAVGGLLVHKRQKRDYHDKISEDGYNASCSWEPASSRSEDSTVTDESKHNYQTETSAEVETKAEPESSEPDNNANKTFKAADFDLDAKIAALPSLSLEKFQQKKRENKRKKKTVNLKPKVLGSSHMVNSAPSSMYDNRREFENWRETVIGSQKRKPRKISITRLEINSLVSNLDVNEAFKVSPEIKIATEAPSTVAQNMDVCNQQHDNADLMALATLAEVAANTSKIGDIYVENMTAKASEHNASTV